MGSKAGLWLIKQYMGIVEDLWENKVYNYCWKHNFTLVDTFVRFKKWDGQAQKTLSVVFCGSVAKTIFL